MSDDGDQKQVETRTIHGTRLDIANGRWAWLGFDEVGGIWYLRLVRDGLEEPETRILLSTEALNAIARLADLATRKKEPWIDQVLRFVVELEDGAHWKLMSHMRRSKSETTESLETAPPAAEE